MGAQMDIKLIAAVISAIVALIGSGFTIIGQMKLAKLKAQLERERDTRLADFERKQHETYKREEADKILSKYREPLLHATFELQSRIFNIIHQDFLTAFYVKGNERERSYAVENTLYIIAQYLCWSEIIRREIQFLDLGEVDATRRLAELQGRICSLFLTSRLGRPFRIFRGEQRAIGECMIMSNEDRLRCRGYAEFVEDKRKEFRYWFESLKEDIDFLSNKRNQHSERLAKLQHTLVDLSEFLDPDCIRFSKERRMRV